MADELKKFRKVQRAQFTRTLNEFNNALTKSDDENTELQFSLLKDQWENLETANLNYVQALQNVEGAEEKDLEEAVSTHAKYKSKYFKAKQIFGKKFPEMESAHSESVIQVAGATAAARAPFKRPTLDIPKFDGNIGQWLPFWSHFQKYHEDSTLQKSTKLEFLKASMVKGSKAENIVSGYPTSAANYDAAVEILKNRFGQKKLLSIYYVQQLMAMNFENVLNKNKGKKVLLTSIYDKISAHIRSLESLALI